MAQAFLSGWQSEETKRELLYRLFPKLEEAGDAGLRLVNRMADSLDQQTSFPDLLGWEVISRVRRHASQTGEAYLDPVDFNN